MTALRVLRNVSMNPQTLDALQNCNAIEVLASVLVNHHGGPCGNVSGEDRQNIRVLVLKLAIL